MSEATHEELLSRPYALPKDVKVLPVGELAEHVRVRIGAEDGNFAVTRPGFRHFSRLIDAETVALLDLFQEPTPIAHAIVRYARDRDLDPQQVLAAAFPVLQGFTASRILVPEDADDLEGVEASFVPGQLVLGYEVRRLVRVLQDTEVYLARCPEDRSAALKVARPGCGPAVVPMLAREGDILRRLAGLGTPELFEERVEDRSELEPAFLALEWQSGVLLSQRAQELRVVAGPAWRARLHSLCARLIAAYVALHERGVVHCDVHVGNVLVDGEDGVHLLDFGLSRVMEPDWPHAHLQRPGFGWNTEPEAARELLAGASPPVTLAAEQYAVAALVYSAITGEHPAGPLATREELLEHVLHAPPLPFARQGFESWPEVESVLARALSVNPDDRFPSTAEFLEAFRGAATPPPEERSESRRSGGALARALDGVLERVAGPECSIPALFPSAPAASVQYGAAGLAFFLHRVSLVRESAELHAAADHWGRAALAYAGEPDAFEAAEVGVTAERVGPQSVSHRLPGAQTVNALVSHARGDHRGVVEQIGAFAEGLGSRATIEVAFGRSGQLVAGALLAELVSSTSRYEVPSFTQALEREAECVWANRLDLEQGGARPHLGVAHGLAGLIFAQLRARGALGLALPDTLREQLDGLAARAEPSGRGLSWPGTLHDAESTESTPDHAPGWCAGTAGHVHLWTLAHECFDDARYLALAEQAAWHTWEHPDRGGHLCCGLSGRAFALLRLYQYTGESVWRERAEKLVAWSEDWLVEELKVGDRPLSLYWGALGPLLALAELERPERAAMPLFASEGWWRAEATA